MPTQVIMPQLGESVVEGTVTRWLKQEGEPVEEFESLLEVNTDKVDTEIPAPAGGTLLKILAQEGETIKAGTVIAWIGSPGEAIPGQPEPGEAEGEPAPEVVEPPGDVPARAAPQGNGGAVQTAGRSRELGFISPIVAQLAQEHNINLAQVTGTGEGGRITKKDVLAYLEQTAAQQPVSEAVQPAPWETPGEGDLFRPTEMIFGEQKAAPAREEKPPQPEVAARPGVTKPEVKPAAEVFSMPGEGQLVPLSNIRRRIAEHMVISKRTSPHVTTVMEADLHRMLAHFDANKDSFSRDGARLTYTAYFVAAAVQALRAYPIVNSSWTDEGILIHNKINIGLAVSLGEEGLIVPVLKGADGLSLIGLARAIQDLANRARSRKLQAEDVQGGTFTITNHGISGSLFATPIINQPQCAILGVGAVQKRVIAVQDAAGADAIAIRPMVYLSLTFDHRILDGASADGFLAKVVDVLEHWE
ncbi:MAG: 2-oxo acid dehydrogenase subunit E2 [Chloroflexi bacterium]|nr:2-oxo acid dehydrogenase subunit E2 [Chloroflexota bacterium]